MIITIPDEVLSATRLTKEDVILELAVALFQQEKITLGQAASFASKTLADMILLFADRKIPLHYDETSFEEDLQTFKKLGRL